MTPTPNPTVRTRSIPVNSCQWSWRWIPPTLRSPAAKRCPASRKVAYRPDACTREWRGRQNVWAQRRQISIDLATIENAIEERPQSDGRASRRDSGCPLPSPLRLPTVSPPGRERCRIRQPGRARSGRADGAPSCRRGRRPGKSPRRRPPSHRSWRWPATSSSRQVPPGRPGLSVRCPGATASGGRILPSPWHLSARCAGPPPHGPLQGDPAAGLATPSVGDTAFRGNP